MLKNTLKTLTVSKQKNKHASAYAKDAKCKRYIFKLINYLSDYYDYS